MGVQYNPKPSSLQFAALDSATTLEALREAVKGLFRQISEDTTQERQRTASAVNATGGIRGRYRTVTADGFVNSTDRTIAFDTTAGNVEMTLPVTTQYPGLELRGLVVDASNTATFAPRGAETIDGVAGPYTITGSVVLQANEITRDWVVVG